MKDNLFSLLTKKYKFFIFCFHPKYFKVLGAPSTSSRYLSKALTSVINKEITPKNILEVGAGTGSITKYILSKLKIGDKFDIIEITKEFMPELHNLCKNYPQTNIFNTSILNFKSDYKYNYLISSLPFYSFSVDKVEEILNNYKSLIKDDGTIIYFQYTFTDYINKFKNGKYRAISDLKTAFHTNFNVHKKIEYRNIFPAIIWTLTPKK